MAKKNVYAGPNSTAKIPVRGKVDTPREIIMIALATCLDAVDKDLLTRTRKQKKFSWKTFNGRFRVLRLLAMRLKSIRERNFTLQAIEELYNVTKTVLESPMPSPTYILDVARKYLSARDIAIVLRAIRRVD